MKTMQWSLMLLFSLLLVGCGKSEIVGTEKVMVQTRPLAAFSGLTVSGFYIINVTMGNPQAITLRTNGNLFPYIRTDISRKTLTIETKKGYVLRPQGVPEINIVVPVLSQIDVSGDNRITIKGLTNGDFTLNVSGSNQFVGQGSLNSFTMKASGNTNLDAQKLVANTVDIDSTGNAKMIVNAKNSLKINIAGAATISYIGNPTVKQTINGSGAITKVKEIINK
jgi:Putative auto-transporter adhesin, head GIN domain